MEKKGIDISHHQGEIDFNKLKGNIDFAMVRTSYGSFYEDRKYKRNIKGLESIGVPYGLYHFSYATNIEDAKKEANGFINIIKKYNPTYPVVIDIESSNRTQSVNNNMLVDITDTICSMIESAGYYVMIYANLDYLNGKLNSSKLDRYDKWLAQWTKSPTYNKSFGIWQYSSKGSLPGINGNVDLNISYKDYPSIIGKKNNDNTSSNTRQDEKIENNSTNYVVKKGDTLIKIASKYNMSYKTLVSYNNIKDANKIYVGQIIKIPKKDEVIIPSTYIVKKGDNLIKIAKKYNMNWKDLYELNKNVIGSNPNLIKIGMVLKISG